MAKFRDSLRTVSFVIICRFPFIHALSLLMLLGERANRETYPPFDPKLIYSHLAVLIVCGVCMSFNMQRTSAALVHAGQLLYMAFSVYSNDRLKYTPWTKIRMAHRLVGVAACFLLYSFFQSPRPRNPHLRRIAEALLGVYVMCAVYSLVESADDREAFLKLVPGGMLVFYAYAVLYSAFALCYLPGYFVYDASQLFVPMLIVSTLLVDCNINYWTKKRGMDFWNQIRLISDNVCIIFGLLMYLTCTKKTVYADKKE